MLLILDSEKYPDRLEGPTSFLHLAMLPSPPLPPPTLKEGSIWGVRTTNHPHLVPCLKMSAATPPTAMCFYTVYRDAFAFRPYPYILVWALFKLLPVFLESSRRCCKPSQRITITQLSFTFISIRTNNFTTLEARNCSAVLCLLGNLPKSELFSADVSNLLTVPYSQAFSVLLRSTPMNMELLVSSETPALKAQTPGD